MFSIFFAYCFGDYINQDQEINYYFLIIKNIRYLIGSQRNRNSKVVTCYPIVGIGLLTDPINEFMKRDRYLLCALISCTIKHIQLTFNSDLIFAVSLILTNRKSITSAKNFN